MADGGLYDLLDFAAAAVALLTLAGALLALPLYLSQRRDIKRLRAWMEREPAHPRADVTASEAILDRAETELEEVLGPAALTDTDAVPKVIADRQLTGQRPTLDRVTMEREALAPHPRWRRFVASATQARVLAAVGLVSVLLGIAAVLFSERLLEPEESTPRQARAIDPASVTVTVLNGTDQPGLGGLVGDDVEANEFDLRHVSTTPERRERTVVLFAVGHEPEARKVARVLGVNAVEPLDRATDRLAMDAEVVVIAGEDRASA